MRLLTHNMLQSPLSSSPLSISATAVEVIPTPPSRPLVHNLLANSKLDVPLLASALSALSPLLAALSPPPSAILSLCPSLLSFLLSNPCPKMSDEQAAALHALLMDVHVKAGLLTDDTGREFRVENGIPNMILLEDEL